MAKVGKKYSKIVDFKFTRIIVDSSVLIKAMIMEEGSELVKNLINLNKNYQLSLLATPLIFFEFLNVLSKGLKNKTAVQEALKKFFKFNIGVIDVKYGYLEKGIKLACENNQVSYYDSSYHALAKYVDGVFLTADEKYYKVAKNEGNIVLLSNISL